MKDAFKGGLIGLIIIFILLTVYYISVGSCPTFSIQGGNANACTFTEFITAITALLLYLASFIIGFIAGLITNKIKKAG